MKKLHTTLKMKKGFTLVETMVAITVLAIALLGPFAAAQNSLNGSYIARDQLTASALAQEGIEYVRSVRDNNYLSSRNWMDGLDAQSCYGNNPSEYCSVDPLLGDMHNSGAASAYLSCGPLSSCTPLYLRSDNLYTQSSSGNTKTRFTRVVQIKLLSATEVRVTVSVMFTSSHRSFTTTVTDNLNNWL